MGGTNNYIKSVANAVRTMVCVIPWLKYDRDAIMTVTVKGWYYTRRPTHCNHFLFVPHLSSNQS